MYLIGLVVVSVALLGVIALLIYTLTSGKKKGFEGMTDSKFSGGTKSFGENVFQ